MKKKKIPCFGVLGNLILNFSKILNQKATHEPSGQHILNDEYYDRIEAIQFTMNHDDGNLIDEINSTKVPVCVVWGKEDQIIPSNHHQVLNDRIKIIIEKDCGHMAHIEKPSVVNDAINSTIVG